MHKQLMLLALLQRGPLHGYELHRIVRAHGELYADLKKANVYYLLDRLADEGCVEVTAEPGARGARGQRLVYALTEKGRERTDALLRVVLLAFEPIHTGLDVALVLLNMLPSPDVVALLEKRRQAIAARRDQIASELAEVGSSLPVQLAADHLLSVVDAELDWTERALVRLREAGWAGPVEAPKADASEENRHGA